MSSSRRSEAAGAIGRRVQRILPATLTGRLVAVTVALVAVVGLMVAGATALAMRSYLTGQRDNAVEQAFQREDGDGGDGFLGNRPCPLTQPIGGVAARGLPLGQASGTVTVRSGCSFMVSGDTIKALTAAQVDQLSSVPADGKPHSVDVAGLGDYRVVAGGGALTGMPLHDVQQAVRSLVLWELALTITGVLLAGLAGAELVRRTLTPLRAVAQTAHDVTRQQLASGDASIEQRVPEHFTDPATEVGQVGSALNTLLDHVDEALAARHHSEQQVRQFVADASHELRTPLSTIHGYAELSRRTPDDAGQLASAMAKVETEADRMSGLVEDLLLLARLDSGRPLAREEVDVTRLLLEAVADARVVAPDHRWRLELPDEPVAVVGDEQRLHQVITNLLNNARTHTPRGTTVTVSATAGSATEPIEVRVHDDGPGLPPELAAHAFERFTRGDSSRTRASGGAGLGLSLVAAITAAQGGRVYLASAPGDTTFTISLPTS